MIPQPRYIRYMRPAANSDQNTFCCIDFPIHGDFMRACYHATALQNRDAGIIHQPLINASQTIKFNILGFDQGRPVMDRLANMPAKSGRISKISRKSRAIYQQLFGDTSAQNACTAQPVFFNNSNTGTMAGRYSAGANAAGTAAYGYQIKIIYWCHCISPSRLVIRGLPQKIQHKISRFTITWPCLTDHLPDISFLY